MDVAEKRAQKVKVVKAVSAAGAAIAAGVSIVAFPPAMIVLPVIFPLIILVSQGIEWKLEKQVQSELACSASPIAILSSGIRARERKDQLRTTDCTIKRRGGHYG